MSRAQLSSRHQAVHIVSMAQLLKKSPLRLTRIASRVVNRCMPCEDAIFSLQIPSTLKRYVRKNYLKDKFECSEILPPLEEDEMSCWFEEPFLHISNDEWLTIMSWSYGVPYFAAEKNHIKSVFFTMDDGNDKYCYECAYTYCKDNAAYKISKYSDCDVESGDQLIDALQCLDMWCNRCVTRSLFWLEEYPWNTHYITTRVLVNEYHKVDGQWRPREINGAWNHY